jgi:hypothetical protein
VTDLGGAVIRGLAELKAVAMALGEANPVAHHVTNIVVTATAGDLARPVSKGIGISTAGTVGSVTYGHSVQRAGHTPTTNQICVESRQNRRPAPSS